MRRVSLQLLGFAEYAQDLRSADFIASGLLAIKMSEINKVIYTMLLKCVLMKEIDSGCTM